MQIVDAKKPEAVVDLEVFSSLLVLRVVNLEARLRA